VLDCRNMSPVRSSRGVRFLFRALLRRLRPPPFSGPARSRVPHRSRECGSPLLGFLLRSRRHYAGCPFCGGSAVRPTLRARVAKPSPVPSSGFLPLSTVLAVHAARREPLRSPPLPWHPDASRPYHMPLASFGAALQSFPFPGSRARSREPLLPCESAFDRRQRGRTGSFAIAFAARASSLPRPALRRAETHEPGTVVPRGR